MLTKILFSERELSDINFRRLLKALIYIRNNLIDSDNNIYLTADPLIDTNSIITGSNKVTLRKDNIKPYGCDKMCMDKDLIEDKLYQLLNEFNDRKITHRDFYFVLLNDTHPFCEGNATTCKMLVVSNFK